MLQKVGAEMVGTFALVFAGCGAIGVDSLQPGRLGHLGVALTFGLVILVMVSAVGHISGAHFNPAVTIAFASIGRFPWRQVPAYVLGQVIAALLGAGALLLILGAEADPGVTQLSIDGARGWGLELVITALLMFVITAVATDSRATGHVAALAIGGTVCLCALFAGPLTGASMNPARSLGPALVSGNLTWMGGYISATIVGAGVGAWLYEGVRCGELSGDGPEGCC